MKKKLRLHRETLRLLDSATIGRAAGGAVTDIFCINTITIWPTACECETRNTNATEQCTVGECTADNTHCLCPVC